MISVREYLPCDVFEVQRRNGDFINPLQDVGEASVFAATFVDGSGCPLGCVGGQIQWAGVAQIWAVLSDGLRGHGLYITRECRAMLERECRRYGIRRVHCLVRADSEEYLRWISLLGFEHEFSMREAAPDGADLWGMTRWCDGRSSGCDFRRGSRARASTAGSGTSSATTTATGPGAGRHGERVGRVPVGEAGADRAA